MSGGIDNLNSRIETIEKIVDEEGELGASNSNIQK